MFREILLIMQDTFSSIDACMIKSSIPNLKAFCMRLKSCEIVHWKLADAFNKPCRTRADTKLLWGVTIPQASCESAFSVHFQYPARNSSWKKGLLSSRSLSSAYRSGIGHFLDIVAAFTGHKSIVLHYFADRSLGTSCGADCHATWSNTL